MFCKPKLILSSFYFFSPSSSSEGWTAWCLLIEVPLMDREIIALHITLDQGQCQDLFLINAVDM